MNRLLLRENTGLASTGRQQRQSWVSLFSVANDLGMTGGNRPASRQRIESCGIPFFGMRTLSVSVTGVRIELALRRDRRFASRTKKTRGSRSANRMVIPWRQGTEHGSRSQFLLSRHPSQIPAAIGLAATGLAATGPNPRGTSTMARNRKQRRQQHGSAWHCRQTDCWYCTPSGTRKRVPLSDEDGQRIRGKDNREGAQLALPRIKLSDQLVPVSSPARA